MTARAAVEFQAQQTHGIQAEPHGAVGKPGLIIEHECLAPFFGLRRCGSAITVIVVEVEVAQVQVGFAVADKISRRQWTQDQTHTAS
ncbi:hypothetical protein D3C84_1051860 [compost metagenome]